LLADPDCQPRKVLRISTEQLELNIADYVNIIIMNAATKSELSAGKSPMGLAASILYLSSLINGCNNISQTVFAQTAGVTEVTIRNISKDLKNHLDLS